MSGESGRAGIERLQEEGMRRLLDTVLGHGGFHARRLAHLDLDPGAFSLRDLARLPLLTKAEVVEDQELHPPYGSLPTRPLADYVRVHRTSGTTGSPLRWLDTPESWQAFLDCWKKVFEAAGIRRDDRILVAFSFGPFIGFWGAFEAAQQLGAMVVSGGAQSTRQRLQTLTAERCTVLVSTPTYALHLAEVAEAEGIDLAAGMVRRTIHAGEPGASVPAVRDRLAELWGARVFDHAGATELGAWGYPATFEGAEPGEMCVNEEHFVAEVLDPGTGEVLDLAADRPTRGELVLTSFRRLGSPLIRYRTGDLVEALAPDARCAAIRLRGGVLGRVDDMVVVRGVNIYPSAVENVVFADDDVAEFRAIVRRRGSLSELELELEPKSSAAEPAALAERVGRRLHDELALRVPVRLAEESLPRWELKARRFAHVDD